MVANQWHQLAMKMLQPRQVLPKQPSFLVEEDHQPQELEPYKS
jgi:hypothetical protein